MTLLVCIAFFVVGSMHPYLFQQHADTVAAAKYLGWIVPNLTYFFPLDSIMKHATIPAPYFGMGAAYCACCVTAVLAVGVVLFQRRSQLEGGGSSGTMPTLVSLLAWLGRAAAVAAAVVGLLILTMPAGALAVRVAVGAALVVLAPVLWVFWGCFVRGSRWSYWLLLILAALDLVRSGIVLLPGPTGDFLAVGEPDAQLIVHAVAAAVVLLILVLPASRRHFSSANVPS
jgi:hypothetical protein